MTTSRPWPLQQTMLRRVAVALGPTLVKQVAFVGGCTVELLVTDPVVREDVRFTEDVDLIVHVLGPSRWHQLEKELATRGFHSSFHDDITCRKRLSDGSGAELIVDFMPDDPAILGFGNRWYADALHHAEAHVLDGGVSIRVVTPPYFLGTKLDAWRGRGRNDPIASRDVEDILSVVDGRPALLSEVEQGEPVLRQDIAGGISGLLDHRDFVYAVQSAVRNNRQREEMLFRRLEQLAALGD